MWELNKQRPLAEYEVAVHKKANKVCQREFSVTFDISGGNPIPLQVIIKM